MKIGQHAAQKIIMVVVTHQAEKIWTYDCTTVWLTIQGATFNIRGQLHHGHANATALSSSLVVSALGSELDNLGSSPGCGKALCPWDVQEKKMRALLLGLAKSIYYYHNPIFCPHVQLVLMSHMTKYPLAKTGGYQRIYPKYQTGRLCI